MFDLMKAKAQKNPSGAPVTIAWPVPAVLQIGMLLIVGMLLSFPVQARSAPESFADLADELLPTVVNISTSQVVEDNGQIENFEELFRDFFERRGNGGEDPDFPRQRRTSSLGSGFIIDSNGYIVTNNHVVAGADEIAVRLFDNTTLEAEIVGTDEKTDLALLKVETDRDLPAADWGDSDSARVGEWILAIGNPYGLGGSVTAGIISARQRDINAGPYDDFLQTDASINRGNSGGPTFDMDGRVIGVNTAIFSPSGGSVGIGFAIPSAMARNVVDSLKEHGEVRRGWLGVQIQTVTEELAEGLRLPEAAGALVASLFEDGPADKGGIQQGDVILEFDGREVADMRELPRMVAETRVGKEVDVVVWRRGEERTLTITLGEMDDEALSGPGSDDQREPQPEPESGSLDDLGLELGGLSEERRSEFGLPRDIEGVLVTEIDPRGLAAEAGLQPGDVIAEVDQEPVSRPADIEEHVVTARQEGYRVITLLILRADDYLWVALPLGEE
ncbi:DegQ family serine endoprotease [Fodinicurvata fenggangensis]|uniref:DegQ family serine endoprotease n=1 Tax=Fodinicurvata fenggangensis TaxID=1121830 RepID=UPI001FE0535F|nr:DegQ family serine endoprotease [Fodinicurvata fenggangensis]